MKKDHRLNIISYRLDTHDLYEIAN